MPKAASAPKRSKPAAAPNPKDVLDLRQRNRALLARQLLLAREEKSVTHAVTHLIGMQAQKPKDPYIALWSRITDFVPADLEKLILKKDMVRMAAMRSTVHLMTRADAQGLRALVSPALERALMSSSPYGKAVKGIDLEALLARGRALLEEEPRSLADLRKHLSLEWPGYDAASLAYNVHYLLPLVQLPPRGLWEKSGQPICTTAEHYFGQPAPKPPSFEAIVLRYLAAFGPATYQDAQKWSGLTQLKETFEKLRPKLRTFRNDQGKELFDLPDAPRPDPETPAPPRFLPEYDNLFLSHVDRRHLAPESARQSVQAANGAGPCLLLVDGFIRATWKVDVTKGRAELTVRAFDKLSKAEQRDIAREAEEFVPFMASDAKDYDVIFA